MNDKCSRCEEVDAFPYWENRPVCYACYFLFVGEYKVEMHTQLTQLRQENERLQKQLVELKEEITEWENYEEAAEWARNVGKPEGCSGIVENPLRVAINQRREAWDFIEEQEKKLVELRGALERLQTMGHDLKFEAAIQEKEEKGDG